MSSTPTTQAPTTQEIETSFIRVLSNGPLSLEAITDRMNGFGQGHEDAVVAVFEYMVEGAQDEGEGEATYQLRSEYRSTTNTTGNHATPPLPSKSSPRRKTAPAPLSFTRSPTPSPQLSSSSSLLSSPPTHLSSPAPSLPPRPRPRSTSTPLSSPPPSSQLRSPTPAPSIRPTRRAGRKGKGKPTGAKGTTSRVTNKAKKTGADKGKKGRGRGMHKNEDGNTHQ
ncbi:hypothetical protein J3E72DRAFT_267634 [Bipolaris maydis]|nr:hypothetical protein J3E72DRAFT_267634 [Bipolaris maydis]